MSNMSTARWETIIGEGFVLGCVAVGRDPQIRRDLGDGPAGLDHWMVDHPANPTPQKLGQIAASTEPRRFTLTLGLKVSRALTRPPLLRRA